MNKNLNLDDVQKFTKYYVKLNSLHGGGDTSKKQIYDQKLTEYTSKLQQNGVNTNQVIQIIQNGGSPITELQAQISKINSAIEGISIGADAKELKAAVGKIRENVTEAKSQNATLQANYKEYVEGSHASFLELYKKVLAKADEPGSVEVVDAETKKMANPNDAYWQDFKPNDLNNVVQEFDRQMQALEATRPKKGTKDTSTDSVDPVIESLATAMKESVIIDPNNGSRRVSTGNGNDGKGKQTKNNMQSIVDTKFGSDMGRFKTEINKQLSLLTFDDQDDLDKIKTYYKLNQ